METGPLVALVAGVALLLALLCVLAVVVVSGRRARRALDASRADIDSLHARLDALSAEIAAPHPDSSAVGLPENPSGSQTNRGEYLITTAGEPDGAEAEAVANRVVLSATVGEPLVKLVALAYGVRRALAPETRNRIAFEMRREVKRARKQRKRDLRRRSAPLDTTADRSAEVAA